MSADPKTIAIKELRACLYALRKCKDEHSVLTPPQTHELIARVSKGIEVVGTPAEALGHGVSTADIRRSPGDAGWKEGLAWKSAFRTFLDSEINGLENFLERHDPPEAPRVIQAREKLRAILKRHEHDWDLAWKGQDRVQLNSLVLRLGGDIEFVRDSNLGVFADAEAQKLAKAIYECKNWIQKRQPWGSPECQLEAITVLQDVLNELERIS